MAEQGLDHDVKVYHALKQQGLRLLELPPELCDLLSASDTAKTFTLKSSAEAAHAVLCTTNKTYQIRQIQSSNSLFILQPLNEGLSTFATCSSTLQLQAIDQVEILKLKSAVQWLLEYLPIYDDGNDSLPKETVILSKTELFAKIPFSNGELDNAWYELMAFTLDGRAYKPTPALLVRLWAEIYSASTAQVLDLSERFECDMLYGLLNQHRQQDPYPRDLFQAVLMRCNHGGEALSGGSASFRSNATTNWVGEILLTSGVLEQNNKDTLRFLERWKNLLPEQWRNLVCLQKLSSLQSYSISLSRLEPSLESQSKDSTTSQAASRDWHERLKRIR